VPPFSGLDVNCSSESRRCGASRLRLANFYRAFGAGPVFVVPPFFRAGFEMQQRIQAPRRFAPAPG